MAARPTPEVMTDKELAKANSTGQEIAISRVEFDDDALSAIQSFDDALALLADDGVVIQHASDVIGNGFAILKDKGILCNVETMLLGWSFNGGENGGFVSAYAVAKMPGMKVPAKFVVNDGGSGIYKQLLAFTKKTGVQKGMHLAHGLTRSDYTKEIDGEERPAVTFYLDTSA